MMSKVNDKCVSIHTDKIIKCQENKCSINFLNASQKKIKKILVDNCAITTGIRCDYMILSEENMEHYIELKGTDINHAFKQLKRTIQLLSSNPISSPKHAYVIAVRVPLITTSIQIQKAIFKKSFNSSLTLKSRQFSVPL